MGARALATMKLGEYLVSAGRITASQVEEALKEQAIFGGRFGTNLVEMGYLEEHDLAHYLSKKSGVPHASPELLMNAPNQLISLIPEETVRKYRMVPVALNNRKLTLAMSDPSDFESIDEISFVTGYIVVPMVTPDLRLVCALEKHYNIKQEQRYIKVEGGGRNRARHAPPPAPGQATPARPAPSVPDDPDILELPPLADCEYFGDMQATDHLVHDSLTGGALQWGSPKRQGMEDLLHGLAHPQDWHNVAQLVVDYTAQKFRRCALLQLTQDKATGWIARLENKPLAGFRSLEISLGEPSVLLGVARDKTCFQGPIPFTPCNARLIAALGGGNPLNNLLLPLVMTGRVVAVLYVEDGTLRLDERIPGLQTLLGKMSMAFEILILRGKILLT